MGKMIFNSVREINAACSKAAYSGFNQDVRVAIKDEFGTSYVQVSRARTVKGFLQVKLVSTGQWVDCLWSDLVIQ